MTEDTTGFVMDELTGELYENPYPRDTYDWWTLELKNFDKIGVLERELEENETDVVPKMKQISQAHAKGIFVKIFCKLVRKHGIEKIYLDQNLRLQIKRLILLLEKSNKSIGFLLNKDFILKCSVPGVVTENEVKRMDALRVQYQKLMNELLSEMYSNVHRIPGIIPDARSLVSQYLTNREFSEEKRARSPKRSPGRQAPGRQTRKKSPKRK